jgi:NADPH-dependent 2,4-dienoyl-CoA reductase/sulfur reductase-like enzyme
MTEVRSVDVAVVGAGPAGIAAACAAAEAGRRVLLLDEGVRPGGQIWRHGAHQAPPRAARRWLARLGASGAEFLNGTTVVDGAAGRLAAERAGAAMEIRAPALVLATGARERFLPFPGWTLPGVIGVGAAQALLKGGLNMRGQRTVVAGTGPLPLAVAATLRAAGARVSTVAEQAPARTVARFAAGLWRTPTRALQALRYRTVLAATRYRTGTWIVAAAGQGRVARVTLTDGRRRWDEPCDWLCAAWGLVPASELANLLGCVTLRGATRVDDALRTSLPGIWSAGEAAGVAGVEAALVEGELAGRDAAGRPPRPDLRAARRRYRGLARRMEEAFAPRPELGDGALDHVLICRCEDVPMEAVRAMTSFREARLHTRLGMGPCQGRVCGTALEFLRGWEPAAVRPPVLPAAAGTMLETDDNPMGDT